MIYTYCTGSYNTAWCNSDDVINVNWFTRTICRYQQHDRMLCHASQEMGQHIGNDFT